MAELGLAKGQVRQLQDVPMDRLLAAYAAIRRQSAGARARPDRELADR